MGEPVPWDSQCATRLVEAFVSVAWLTYIWDIARLHVTCVTCHSWIWIIHKMQSTVLYIYIYIHIYTYWIQNIHIHDPYSSFITCSQPLHDLMKHSYLRHDSRISEISLAYMWHVWHESFTTCNQPLRDLLKHSHLWHESSIPYGKRKCLSRRFGAGLIFYRGSYCGEGICTVHGHAPYKFW